MDLSRAGKTKLRFAIGARVECNLDGWKPGTVVEHFFVQEGFAAGMCVPYQVALDDGHLIFARQDEDRVIRALLVEPDPVPSMFPQRENQGAVMRGLLRALLNIFYTFLLMQVADIFTTGYATFALNFADSEMPLVVNGRFSVDAFGVVALTAGFAVLGLQARGSSKCEWLERAGIRSRSGKADPPALALLIVFNAFGQELFYRGALPALATRLFPDNPNNVAAGLVISIVLFSVLHPAEYAFYAAFSGFWFAVAAFHSGVVAAIFASLLAQLGAAMLYLGDESETDEAPLPAAGYSQDKERPAAAEAAAAEAAAEAAPEEEEEPWAPMPWLDPYLPLPESRAMVLRSLRASGVYLALSYILLQFGDYLAPGQTRLSLSLSLSGGYVGWLSTVVSGVATGLFVTFALDHFSAAGAGAGGWSYMADAASAWLNGRKGSLTCARYTTRDGKPDRVAILIHAACTAVGQETLFRGALPALWPRLAETKLLPEVAASYPLTASVLFFYALHPDELKAFACFAGVCFALTAFAGGLGAAIVAGAVSQVGACSIFYHARNRAKAAPPGKEKDKGKPGSAKKAGKKQR